MPKATGAAGLEINQYTPEEVRYTETTAPTSTLSDFDISKNQSSQWQQLAALPGGASPESGLKTPKPGQREPRAWVLERHAGACR